MIGVSAGRNLALYNIDTKYALIGDNDFIYEKTSGVDKMRDVLDARPDIGLVCGGITENGKKLYYEGFIERKFDTINYYLQYTKLTNPKWESVGGHKIVPIDIGFNYFLMRTDIFPKTFWCPKIKVSCEHSDFFLRAKENKVSVVYVEDAFVVNDTNTDGVPKEYFMYRSRRSDCRQFGENWDVKYGVDFYGARLYFDAV